MKMVWEGGKGEGYSAVSNLIRLSVRYDSVLSTLSISLALIFSCVRSSNKGAFLWVHVTRPFIASFWCSRKRCESAIPSRPHTFKTRANLKLPVSFSDVPDYARKPTGYGYDVLDARGYFDKTEVSKRKHLHSSGNCWNIMRNSWKPFEVIALLLKKKRVDELRKVYLWFWDSKQI